MERCVEVLTSFGRNSENAFAYVRWRLISLRGEKSYFLLNKATPNHIKPIRIKRTY